MKPYMTMMLVLITSLFTSISVQAQTKLPATAKLVDDNGDKQLYLNVERAASEDDLGGVTSVWLYNKQQNTTTRILVSNPEAQGAWDRMQNHNAVPVAMNQVAAADNARFIVGDSKIIVEGCPDARNIWSYIIDLNTKKAVQLSSNAGLVGFCGEDETYIVMSSYRYNPDPEVGGRFPVLLVFSTEGRFMKELEVR